MRGFDRSRENPTHTVALGTTITERADLQVGVQGASRSIRGGLISGEHYTAALARAVQPGRVDSNGRRADLRTQSSSSPNATIRAQLIHFSSRALSQPFNWYVISIEP